MEFGEIQEDVQVTSEMEPGMDSAEKDVQDEITEETIIKVILTFLCELFILF